MSLNGDSGGHASAAQPNLAGSLADALLARKNAMQNRRQGEDDW
jgi:myosin I